MKIVEVKVYPFADQSKSAKAFCRIMFSLDKTGEVHMTWNSCKIVEGRNGLFVALPSYPKSSGEGYDSPIFVDFKSDKGGSFLDYLTAEVLAEFKRTVGDAPTSQTEPDDDDIPF